MKNDSVSRDCTAARAARVLEVERVCREHVRVTVKARDFPDSVPGQFLQLLCAGDASADEATVHEIEWTEGSLPQPRGVEFLQRSAFLRRPFSIADRDETADGSLLSIISRNIGVGTEHLDQLRAGDELSVTGPLGRGFVLPPVGRPIVLVGGGVGIPPLLYTARSAAAGGHVDVTGILGVTSGDLLPVGRAATPDNAGRATRCVRWPADAPYKAIVTTDDGSLGLRGRVTDGLDAWRAQRGAGPRPVVLACGPEPMLHALAKYTRAAEFDCQLCIEKYMGCGLGTCLSCVVRRRAADKPDGWRWALSCTEGPVFERDELLEFAG